MPRPGDSQRPNPAGSGWLIVDKPLGMTSTQVVSHIKRWLGWTKSRPFKIGHGGTLDPLASGVLPIAVGEATKLISYCMDGEKTYEFSIKWGASTTTLDGEGRVTATSSHRPSRGAITASLPSFMGEIDQVPPSYSALKVDGHRAYDLARSGVDISLPPRRITITDLRILDDTDVATFFQVLCSKGTYVRSLARDIATALGVCGHVGYLRRTRVGPFRVQDAMKWDHIQEKKEDIDTIFLEKGGKIGHKGMAGLYPLLAVLDDIPVVAVEDNTARCLALGQLVQAKTCLPSACLDAKVIMCTRLDGAPVALVENNGGHLKVRRGFNC